MDIILKYLTKNITEKGIIKIILKYTSNKSADIFVESGIKVEYVNKRNVSYTIIKMNDIYRIIYTSIISNNIKTVNLLLIKRQKNGKTIKCCNIYNCSIKNEY